MLVDVAILGDTPFALSVQSVIRKLGLTTCLIYIGDMSIRHMYVENVDFPHKLCSYSFEKKMSRLQILSYQRVVRERLGGDCQFIYQVISKFGSSFIPIRIGGVSKDRLLQHNARVGNPNTVAICNKFVRINKEVIHFGTLVVEESLKKFLARIGWDSSGLRGANMGVLLEESVPLLPSVIKVEVDDGDNAPILSMARGFLWYHYYPERCKKVNFTLKDYVKVSTLASMDIISGLERRDVLVIGPRAAWNTALTLESELLRLRELLVK